MNEIVGGLTAPAAGQERAAQWAVRAGTAFGFEKRKVDAQFALIHVEGHVKTELVNALRSIAQHLRP